MGAKLKMNAEGVVEINNGMPMLVYDDGKESPLDFNHLIGQVKATSDERDTLRREALPKAQAFEALGASADEIKAALKTVSALSAQKLIEANKVDALIAERVDAATKSLTTELEATRMATATEKARVRALTVSNRFAESKLLKERTTLSPDLAESRWGSLFDPQDDNTVRAKYPDGSPIYSRIRHGQPADFDEALEILIDMHPNKATFMRGTGSRGSDADGGAQHGAGKKATREQFEAMPAHERAVFFKDGGKLVD